MSCAPPPENASIPAGARARRGWYQLEERHATMQARLAAAIVALLVVVLVAPLEMSGAERAMAAGACTAALALHACLRWMPERWPRTLRTAVDAGLAVDAALVLALALASGGSDSLALWLLPLYALAATLALSVRTGVKAAILSALVLGALSAAEGLDAPARETLGPLALVAGVLLVAGSLTAVNDRQMLRLGERMTILHRATAEFVAADDPARLAAIAARAGHELLPGWTVEVRLDGADTTEHTWRTAGRVHLDVPVHDPDARDDAGPGRTLAVIAATRPARRTEPVRLRRDHLVALRTLSTALAVALQRAELVHRLEHLSMADALTGLGNRRAFDEAMAVEMARARRTGAPMSLVLADVDHFKRFNDTHGHQAGDAALAEVARVLTVASRTEDRACRVGGEEFALLLPGADEDAAAAVAERVRRGVEAIDLPWGPVTVSLGVAGWDGEDDGAALISAADARLYAAKGGGRNRVVAGAS